jgi:hypothetical protein
MLVYDQFEGDDTGLALRQDAVFSAAVDTIIALCERHYDHACTIARVPADRWPEDDRGLDRKVLQEAHDVLAAAWRWQIAPPQPQLALEWPPRAFDMADWLHWLRDEVDAWHTEPDLVLAVVSIVADGPEAAPLLAGALRMRHAGVPWHGHLVGEDGGAAA